MRESSENCGEQFQSSVQLVRWFSECRLIPRRKPIVLLKLIEEFNSKYCHRIAVDTVASDRYFKMFHGVAWALASEFM